MDKTTRNIILAASALSGFLASFLATAINIALPAIQKEFDLSAVVLDWIPLVYVLAAGALLMPVGRVADTYGRMKIFLVGLAGFTVFALVCAFSPSGPVLLVMRALNGLAAALLFATNIVLVTSSQPSEIRGRALGILTAGVYLGSTAGPVLGGLISQDLGWRALFWMVGGIGLVVTLLSIWKLRHVEWKEPKRARFDLRGSAVWFVAFPGLLMGSTFLPSLIGWLLLGAGALGLVFFVWWEARAADPILSVSLLRHNRVFAFSNAAALINYSATFAMTFLMSLYLQYNRDLGPRTAGFVLVSGTLLQALVSPLAGRLSDRLESSLVAAAGMGLCTLGLLGFAFLGETTPYWYMISSLCILGMGFGLFASPMAHVVMESTEKCYVGTASATLATMRVAGQGVSMGIAGLLLGVIVGRHEIEPTDYPHLLTSVRISFAVFAALCALGVVSVLVGRHPSPPPQAVDAQVP
jgi:MFS family permease